MKATINFNNRIFFLLAILYSKCDRTNHNEIESKMRKKNYGTITKSTIRFDWEREMLIRGKYVIKCEKRQYLWLNK